MDAKLLCDFVSSPLAGKGQDEGAFDYHPRLNPPPSRDRKKIETADRPKLKFATGI
jgi:hypothetical protein